MIPLIKNNNRTPSNYKKYLPWIGLVGFVALCLFSLNLMAGHHGHGQRPSLRYQNSNLIQEEREKMEKRKGTFLTSGSLPLFIGIALDSLHKH